MPTVRIIIQDSPSGPRVRMEIEGRGESKAVELGLMALKEIRRKREEEEKKCT